MELTRRDAAAALAALGAGGAVAFGTRRWQGEPNGSPTDGDLPADEEVRDVLVAVADVVYPSEVSGIREFVGAFLDGRLDREHHARGLREAVSELQRLSEEWYGDRYPVLAADERDDLLREVGADTADEDPEGTTAERIRYYVVGDLLLALYASPTGGELVGIENPQGHPGGTDSYQRGPPS